MKILLQDMTEDLRFEDLPPAWNTFDLESFSKDKRLWDYQQNALKNAIKVLWSILRILWIIKKESSKK